MNANFEDKKDDLDIILDGVIRILSLEYEMKMLREDIKVVKQDVKENGIEMKIFNKVLKEIKAKIKKNDGIAVDNIVEKLLENDNVGSLIERLKN